MEETQKKQAADKKKELVNRVLSAHKDYVSALNNLWEHDRLLCTLNFMMLDISTSLIMKPRIDSAMKEADIKGQEKASAE